MGKTAIKNFSKKHISIGESELELMIEIDIDSFVFFDPLKKICATSFKLYEMGALSENTVNLLFPLFVEYENTLYDLLVYLTIIDVNHTWTGKVYKEIRKYGKKKKNLKCAETVIRILDYIIGSRNEILFYELQKKLAEVYAVEYNYKITVDQINPKNNFETIKVSTNIESVSMYDVLRELHKKDTNTIKRHSCIKTIYGNLDEACCVMYNLSFLPDSPLESMQKQMIYILETCNYKEF